MLDFQIIIRPPRQNVVALSWHKFCLLFCSHKRWLHNQWATRNHLMIVNSLRLKLTTRVWVYACVSLSMWHMLVYVSSIVYIASFKGEQNNILYMSYFHTYYNPLTLKPIVKANLRENISCNEFLIPWIFIVLHTARSSWLRCRSQLKWIEQPTLELTMVHGLRIDHSKNFAT